MGRLRGDAHMSTFCCSWQDPPKSWRRKVATQKSLDISRQIITWPRDFLFFFIAYFILPKRNSSVKTISISADDNFSPLRWYIFSHRNMFILIQTGSTYKNTTGKTLVSYFFAIYGKFRKMSRPLRDDDFTKDLTQGEKLIGIFYNIFRGNANKYLIFPRINIILIQLWLNYGEKALISLQNRFFGRRNNISPRISF